MTEKQKQALDAGRQQFSKNRQPKNNGRRKSNLKHFIKQYSVSKTDVDSIFQNLIFNSSLEQLEELVKPENKSKQPVIVVLLVGAFLKDIEKGTLSEVNTVLDRIYGKATQQVEVGEKQSDIPEDPEGRRALAELIKKEIGAWRGTEEGE